MIPIYRPVMAKGLLAIAVDFGTTYTGVSYRVVRGMEELHGPAANQIPWPGPNGTSFKVPSIVCYDTRTSALISYGYTAKDISTSPFYRKMRNFKLRLFLPEETDNDPSASPTERMPRTPEEAVVDFLTQVYGHVLNTLRDRGLGPENTEYNVLFTVPATYRPYHVENFRILVNRTPWKEHGISINMMEPEAAARHTIHNTMRNIFNIGECFVLCDAGGGTVDLASYKIKQINPKLELEQTGVVDGDPGGSTRIDKRFSQFLQQCIGSDQTRALTPEQKNDMMNRFIKKKELFQDDHTTPFYNIKLNPESLQGQNIVNGKLRISRNMMQEMFEPSITTMKHLINNHIESCHKKGLRVGSIFLVGGLGSSPYVLKCIRTYASELGIMVYQPGEAEYAVVLGATATQAARLRGDADPVKLYLCPAHYGVLCSTPWDPHRHREGLDESFINPLTNRRMAINQIAWLISKGEHITNSRQKDIFKDFERSFIGTPNTVWSDAIVMSTMEYPPYRLGPGVMRVCSLMSDMTHEAEDSFEVGGKVGKRVWYKKRKRFRRCKFHIVVKVGTTDLEFVMRYKGQVRCELMTINWKQVEPGMERQEMC